jgi:hypothetical protein
MYTTAEKIEVKEVNNEGLVSLLGKQVLLLCLNYFYFGVLEAVSDTEVKLSSAHIVYETGGWLDSEWKDSQSLGGLPHYVRTCAIESYREVAKEV